MISFLFFSSYIHADNQCKDLYQTSTEKIKSSPVEQIIKKKWVVDALKELKSEANIFSSDRAAALFFASQTNKADALNKTYKVLELGVAYGPSWRQENFDPQKVVKFRMYAASGQHRDMAAKAYAVFGDRVEYIYDGLVGVKKEAGQTRAYYFKALGHEKYTSDWGRELLTNPEVKWIRL